MARLPALPRNGGRIAPSGPPAESVIKFTNARKGKRKTSVSRSRFVCSVAFAVLVASAPAFSDIMFTDGTFADANYTQVGLHESGATITGAQCASCGHPGFALQVVENFSVSDVGFAALGFVNNTFSYNPSTQGAILSINVASVDKDATLSGAGSGTSTNTFRPLIQQDGKDYLAAIFGPDFDFTDPSTTGFVTIAKSGLVAADFVQYNFLTGKFGSATPNFAGDAMLFGLAQISSGFPSGARIEQDYDNLSLSLTTAPEPSSVWLLVSLLLLVGLGLRGRQFKLTQVRHGTAEN
jgi:hypothetical protein